MARHALLAAAAVGVVATAYATSAKRVEGKINVHIVPHTHDDGAHTSRAGRGAPLPHALALRWQCPAQPHPRRRRSLALLSLEISWLAQDGGPIFLGRK